MKLDLLTKEILRLQEENEKLKSRLKAIEVQVTEKYFSKITERVTYRRNPERVLSKLDRRLQLCWTRSQSWKEHCTICSWKQETSR